MQKEEKLKIGDLVRHAFQPDTQDGHGIIIETRSKENSPYHRKNYFKVKWVGPFMARHSQWFPERELIIISRVDE